MTEAQEIELGSNAPGFGSRLRVYCRSLRVKAFLLVALLVAGITGVSTKLSNRAMVSLFCENECSRTSEWAESLASSASKIVESQDQVALQQAVNDLLRRHAVAYAAFTDGDGQLLASSETKAGLLASNLLPDGRRLKLDGEPIGESRLVEYEAADLICAEVLVPVYSNQLIRHDGPTSRPIVGYLRLSIDVSDVQAQLGQVVNKTTHISWVLMLLAIPVSLRVTRHVVSPLNELSKTARAIANGATDARASVSTKDEIGTLAYSFNTMADRLTESRVELLELNAALEQRVQQRTRELEELASRDPLTGLYNRRHFSEVMAREFAAAERYDADMTCMMLDLDHFKEINDLFGHRTGDDVLIALARAIHTELRESDVAARFGGDEFIVLLPQTSAAPASMLVERIVQRYQKNLASSHPDVPSEVSIGVASLRTTRAHSAEALIHEADTALYSAKDKGRNCVVEAHKAVSQT